MKHYTNDPGTRAQDIALREAEKTWRKTGSGTAFAETFSEIFQSALREMQDPLAERDE
ncbi:MAG: hypothetical protein ABSF47_03950 [Minisyncoccia bacterium]|jgi:hypothetical protein